MAIGVGCQNNCAHGLQLFGVGSPPEGVDGSVTIGLLVLDVGVDLCDLGVFEEVVDAHVSVAGSIGHEGVLRGKSRYHDFAFLADACLDGQLLFQGHLFEDSRCIQFYSA